MPSNSTTPRLCIIPDCNKIHHSRGYCKKHGARLRATGTTDARVYPTPTERFWSKVNFDGPLWNGTPCWVWTAGKNRGYGRTSWDGRPQYAHRISYELLVGPIPDGLTIDHLCRNRACENPGHLEPVTMRVNCLRGIGPSAYHAIKTHCVHGHPFDEANTMRRRDGRECRACKRILDRRYNAKRKGKSNDR